MKQIEKLNGFIVEEHRARHPLEPKVVECPVGMTIVYQIQKLNPQRQDWDVLAEFHDKKLAIEACKIERAIEGV